MMARKPRVWYPGAMYHITNRGNGEQPFSMMPLTIWPIWTSLKKAASFTPLIFIATAS